MNRKNAKGKNKLTLKAGIFWSVILVVTLGFFVAIGIKWAQSAKVVTNYSKMEQLVGSELFNKCDETEDGTYYYYVFVYGSDKDQVYSSDVNELEEYICNYLTFVKKNKKNSEVVPLYGFDVCNPNNEDRISNVDAISEKNYAIFKVKESTLPLLIKVKVQINQGTKTIVNEIQKTDVNSIKEILQREIDKLA